MWYLISCELKNSIDLGLWFINENVMEVNDIKTEMITDVTQLG